MPISTDQKYLQVLQTQRDLMSNFDERIQSAAREEELDPLFQELSLARTSIRDAVELHSGQFGPDLLVELQSELNLELDRSLELAVRVFIERHTRSLVEQAQHDPLTGLFNRAVFDQRWREEVERARRYCRNLSLVLFDIDHFKSVNDLHGHTVGDRVLSEVAKILSDSLRKSDATFRYGGDEFAAICPETAGEAIAGVFRRIEIGLKNYCVQVQLPGKIGISWGGASFPVDGGDAGELIEVADRRLYHCKRAHHQTLLTSQRAKLSSRNDDI